MQLNIYVPKDKERILRALHEQAQRTGRQKNELVLEALERFLDQPVVEWKSYKLGVMQPFRRADLYEEWLDEKYERIERQLDNRQSD